MLWKETSNGRSKCASCKEKIKYGERCVSFVKRHEQECYHINCFKQAITFLGLDDITSETNEQSKQVENKIDSVQVIVKNKSQVINKPIPIPSWNCVHCNKITLGEPQKDLFVCDSCEDLFDLELLWELHDKNKIDALDFNTSDEFRSRFKKV